MNVALWIVQILLAAAFLGAGTLKALRPKEELGKQMTWVHPFPPASIKAIGIIEVIGALGLILPWATGIAKVLTPLAAVGLAIAMVGALITHIRLKEYPKELIAPSILLVLSLFVAIGRF